jgi:hypothetical protein
MHFIITLKNMNFLIPELIGGKKVPKMMMEVKSIPSRFSFSLLADPSLNLLIGPSFGPVFNLPVDPFNLPVDWIFRFMR